MNTQSDFFACTIKLTCFEGDYVNIIQEQGFHYVSKFGSQRLPSLRNWKSQCIVKDGKALNFGSHKKILGVNDSQTSTNGSPAGSVVV